MDKEALVKGTSLTVDRASAAYLTKISVCDQKDTAPVWGNFLRQKGLTVNFLEKAVGHWFTKILDLVVIDRELFFNK